MKRVGFEYLGFTLVAFILFSFNGFQEKWEVPGKYQEMENPADADEDNLDFGKELYSKYCKSCHGKEGLGDGPKSGELETAAGDFSMEEFQEQSDGTLFYKTTFGREDMPEFSKKIPDDEDRWIIVHYLRTFAE